MCPVPQTPTSAAALNPCLGNDAVACVPAHQWHAANTAPWPGLTLRVLPCPSLSVLSHESLGQAGWRGGFSG